MTTSVALCTYNGEKYIREQLDSILTQDSPVDEIVICDDGSTDGTAAILQDYETRFPNIFRIYSNSENLGYVRNFEKAMKLCTKDIIFLCDQDDIWYANKVKMIRKTFKENPKIQVVAHNMHLLNRNFSKENYWNLRNFSSKQTNSEILEKILFSGNIFPGMAMTITKVAKESYLPLKNINNLVIHDFEIAVRALKYNSFYALNEILGEYRLHEDQNVGFDLRLQNKTITATDVYQKNKNIDYIRDIVKQFNLDNLLLEKYIVNYNEFFKQYLEQFPMWKRIFIKIKTKYYYKIEIK